MTATSEERQLAEIFLPYASRRIAEVKANNARFVHYTSAKAAMGIIANKMVWMRKTICMNDYMEVQHGLDCLRDAYRSSSGERFKAALQSIDQTIIPRIEKRFNDWVPTVQFNTFVTCMSEHESSEDQLGRLSMWRAYSGSTGVALVLKNAPFVVESDALGAFTSPVAYMDNNGFALQLGVVADNLAANLEFLKNQSIDEIEGYVFHMLIFAVLCAKHPGFSEEREWRIVHVPEMWPSEYLVRSVEDIGGVPQVVCKIPLKNVPERNLQGIEIPELLERIIIGPTAHGLSVREAFIDLLKGAGVTDAESRVVISHIPLR